MAESLLLLHGFTHTGASWRPVVDALGERYRPLAPDLRGHGHASEARPVDLDSVLADLLDLVPERFALGGYSMGGRIALHLALACPDRVTRLVLVGASPGIADAGQREERRRADEALADRLESMGIEALDGEWGETPVLADQPAHVREHVREDRLRSTPAGLSAALRGLGTGALPSLWDRLGELDMPALFLAGHRDAKFSAIAHDMAGATHNGDVGIIPSAGHAAHLEAPVVVGASF